jgi:mercuric ion binding protein
MKRQLFLLAAGLAVSLAAVAGSPRYALDVKGLACPFCAYGIEKHLRNLEGVETVEVDVAGGRVLVTMTGDGELMRERAEQAVDRAGHAGGFRETGRQLDRR